MIPALLARADETPAEHRQRVNTTTPAQLHRLGYDRPLFIDYTNPGQTLVDGLGLVDTAVLLAAHGVATETVDRPERFPFKLAKVGDRHVLGLRTEIVAVDEAAGISTVAWSLTLDPIARTGYWSADS